MKKNYMLSLDIEVVTELRQKTKNLSNYTNSLLKGSLAVKTDNDLTKKERIALLEDEVAVRTAEALRIKQEIKDKEARTKWIA